jgi:hypothetical protein
MTWIYDDGRPERRIIGLGWKRRESDWYTDPWRIETEARWAAQLIGDGWSPTEVTERWGYRPERHNHSGPITCGCARNFSSAQEAEMVTLQNGICPRMGSGFPTQSSPLGHSLS